MRSLYFGSSRSSHVFGIGALPNSFFHRSVFTAIPWTVRALPVQYPSGSTYRLGTSARRADLYASRRPWAFMDSWMAREIPKITSPLGACRSARTRVATSPADRRMKSALVPVSRSNFCMSRARVYS